jgi:hypothetical protein
MEIDGNAMADQIARKGSSHPHTGPQPVLFISTEAAREVTTTGQI